METGLMTSITKDVMIKISPFNGFFLVAVCLCVHTSWCFIKSLNLSLCQVINFHVQVACTCQFISSIS